MSLLDNLNPEQRAAVTLPAGSALILAGAGSGKTRVLTSRIAWLLSTGQATPLSILAVTFTNKAAREMLARLADMTMIRMSGLWIGTFHSLCHRFLRTHYRDANLAAHFQIIDVADQLALIKRMYRAHQIDDERFPPKNLQWFIQKNKEEGLRPDAIAADHEQARRMVEHYTLYESVCQRESVVDFAELLLRSVELLTKNSALREHYRKRFTHLFVDEFQDTNRLQYRWLQLLAGDDASVFAVGDDDQSIYAFRGAHVGNMQRFEHDFAHSNLPVHIARLEQNYRSHGHILDAANALIRHNHARMGKNLWTDAPHGEPLRVFSAESEEDEARFITDIVQAQTEAGVSLSDMAILYRANAQSRALEHALFSASIPYRVYGGLRFFERAEIKHALAYLRLLASPEDEGALLRVINFPARGIGTRSLEQLQDFSRTHRVSLWAATCQSDIGGKSGANIAAFVLMIERLRREIISLPLPEMIEHVLEASGLLAHYRAEREAEERLQNLEELVQAARSFVEERDMNRYMADEEEAIDAETRINPTISRELTAFLTHAALEAGDTQANDDKSALQLMTMHAAKGLEFHTVFITGLEDGLFPHENSLNEPNGLEEERRLMYVAMTRARRQLYLSFAQTRRLHGQFRYNVPSRFIGEIPDELAQWLSTMPHRDTRYFASPKRSPAFASNNALRDPSPHHPHSVPIKTFSGSRLASGLNIGQAVSHHKFGNGIIISAEGSGNDARVQVNFQNHGVKWLSLAYTTLENI